MCVWESASLVTVKLAPDPEEEEEEEEEGYLYSDETVQGPRAPAVKLTAHEGRPGPGRLGHGPVRARALARGRGPLALS